MYSGYGQHYANKTAYFGWPAGTEENDPTNTKDLHFPGISPDAASWLVDKRYVKAKLVDLLFRFLGQWLC